MNMENVTNTRKNKMDIKILTKSIIQILGVMICIGIYVSSALLVLYCFGSIAELIYVIGLSFVMLVTINYKCMKG